MKPFLQTLCQCFEDDSWPVRDAACNATGEFVLTFGAGERREQIKGYLISNLQDPIPSVRQGAAITLSKFLIFYPDELDFFKNYMKNAFDDVKNQKSDVHKFSGLDSKPAVFGVVRRVKDDSLVENQTMYSCGSLAPKMKKKPTCGGGCSASSTFSRKSEPWEICDGAIMLFAEICKVVNVDKTDEKSHGNAKSDENAKNDAESNPKDDETTKNDQNPPKNSPPTPLNRTNFRRNMAPLPMHPLESLFTPLLNTTRNTHYEQHSVLQETVCQKILSVAQSWTGKRFKRHLEEDHVFRVLFNSYQNEVQLTSVAAEECVIGLSQLLGAKIFLGRAGSYLMPDYVEMVDKVMRMRGGSYDSFSRNGVVVTATKPMSLVKKSVKST